VEAATIIDILKHAQGSDERISRQRSSGLVAQVESIKELISSVDFSHGPSQLVSAHGTIDYIVARQAGVTFKIPVTFENNGVLLGESAEVLDADMPVADISVELLSTAKSVVEKLLDGKIEESVRGVSAIAKTINVPLISDALKARVYKAALDDNDPWYAGSIGEDEDVDLPLIDEEEFAANQLSGLRDLLDQYFELVQDAISESVSALSLVEDADVDAGFGVLCADILRDGRRIIKLIEYSRDEDDIIGLGRIVETLQRRVETVVKGLKFIAKNADALED